MFKQLRTEEEFRGFKRSFWENWEGHKPYGFGFGQTFRDFDPDKEDGISDEQTATRWLTTNIDSISGEDSSGMLAAVIDYLYTMQIEIHDDKPTFVTFREKHEVVRLNEYFLGFEEIMVQVKGEEHKNLQVLRNFAKGSKAFGYPAGDFSVIIYPSKESFESADAESYGDMCFRLTSMSNLLYKPNTLNLESVFKIMTQFVYIENGALTKTGFARRSLYGNVPEVVSDDRFPNLHWAGISPKGARIADPKRVRLGAYISPGTVMMPEGACNFNAGTDGPCMIEGRIPQGVLIGAYSDLGGSFSIAGTLSGGGKEKIKIGKCCLGGANGGTGISLGDESTVQAGFYIVPGMLVTVMTDKFDGYKKGDVVKAAELSGMKRMLLLRNSTNGVVELRWNKNPNRLNEALHANAA